MKTLIWKELWRHTPVRSGSYWTIPGFLISWRHTPVRSRSYRTIPGFLISFHLNVNNFHPWIFQALSSILSIHPRLAVSSLATTGVASPSLSRLNRVRVVCGGGCCYLIFLHYLSSLKYDSWNKCHRELLGFQFINLSKKLSKNKIFKMLRKQ